jgi:hypothetical protein
VGRADPVIKPGLHFDLPAEDYHAAHDWLSASGIKKLVPPSTPAHFKAAQGTEEHKPQFDVGKAAHARVLGAGEEVVVVDADDWRSKDARLARDAAYEQGKVPILAKDNVVIDGMAASLAAHPIAPLLFTTGEAEVSAFWTDEATGVPCRARFDWLPEKAAGKRIIVPDLKTAISAAPSEFAKAAARFGYYLQQEHYRDAIRALDIDSDPAFLFVVIEKVEPYLVTVAQFKEPADVRLARGAVDRARRIFAECTELDQWPGYPEGVVDLALPNYLHYDLEEYIA